MNTKVISAFPGTGKTTVCNNFHDPYNSFFVTDSDSSKFSKDNFPQNYLEHIYYTLNVTKPTLLLVSSHEEVRKGLVDLGINFTLVYPRITLLGEYIQRFIDRGNVMPFIDTIYKNWSSWILSCQSQTGCKKIELSSGQYLSDFVSSITKTFVGAECAGG